VRILHTSDWHLGKKLFKVSRLEEQGLFLNWLENILVKQDIDALIMAGDVFDTPHPPHDALELYYSFLSRISKLGKSIFIIAGNHDSGRFLQAPQSFLKLQNVHVVGRFPNGIDFRPQDHVFTLTSKGKNWHIHLLPFFRSHEVLEYVQNQKLVSAQEFPRVMLENPEQLIEAGVVDVLQKFIKSEPESKNDQHQRILVAHHLFGGFRLAGSEQSVSISGLDGLPTGLWGLPYHDLTLGHIHQKQELRKTQPRAIYPGSPIRFRFNEARDKKISILDWSEEEIVQSFIEIPEFRPVISVKLESEFFAKELIEVLNQQESSYGLPGLLEVKLKITGASSGIADQVREALKSTKNPWELLSLQLEGASQELKGEDKERAHVISNFNSGAANMEELFNLYYKKKYPNEKATTQLIEDFKLLIEEIDQS
tara:strand:- start:53306 stop:54580 length:1275 start_codon:yes stop_codon:yes gene_type:complete